MDALRGSGCRLLGFGRVRFPFTFMGIMALAIGLWVVVYLAGHRSLDPVAQELAGATAGGCFGFAADVLIRRVRRGPQHWWPAAGSTLTRRHRTRFWWRSAVRKSTPRRCGSPAG